MRGIEFTIDEYYHVFNRGTDKREIFAHADDFQRFLQSMREFNSINPIGSIYENSFRITQLGNLVSKRADSGQKELVNFICYCLNFNHYHFILQQSADKGIEKFMHRLGVGYTKYFNQKYNRSGGLFQGTFKAVHIDSNEYLLHLSAYVNLNDRVHQFGNLVSKSSWDEYVKGKSGFCEKDIILGQFDDADEYKEFAESSLRDIQERKQDMKNILLEEASLGNLASK